MLVKGNKPVAKGQILIIPLIQCAQSSKIQGEQNGAYKGVEEGEKGELMFNGYRISVLQDEQSSEDGWG